MTKNFVAYFLIVLGCTLVTRFSPAHAASSLPVEYKIKAAIIYKLLKFVEWGEKEEKELPRFTIGVMKKNQMVEALDSLKNKFYSQKINVIKINSLEKDMLPHILFISGSEFDHYQELLNILKGQRTLTIGEGREFCRLGGMICLNIIQDKVKFGVNLSAIRDSGLNLSSIALRAANKVWKKQPSGRLKQ